MHSKSGNLLLISFVFIMAPFRGIHAQEVSKPILVEGNETVFQRQDDDNRVPDSLKREDAVMLFRDEQFYYHKTSGAFSTNNFAIYETQEVHKKIKILTKKGLEDYSRISVDITRYSQIEQADFYIIKNDGPVSKVVPVTHTAHEADDNIGLDEKHLRYSIPGVDTGDIIEYRFKITNPVMTGYPMEIFVSEEIPVMASRLTLRFNHQIDARIRTYNHLPPMENSFVKGDSVHTWNFSFLPGIHYQSHTIPHNELPFIRCMIPGIQRSFWTGSASAHFSKNDTWANLFDYEIKSIQRPEVRPKKFHYFRDFLEDKLKNCDSLSGLQKFRKIYAFVKDSVKIIIPEKYENWSSGYYLYNKEIDRTSLFLLYENLFQYFHFPTYFVFARDKKLGGIDRDMISSYSYTDAFLAFRDESDSLHYIVPQSSLRKFEIDELDPYLLGADAFVVNMQNTSDFTFIRLPQGNPDMNSRVKEGKVNVEPGQNTVRSSVKITYSGAVSTLTRVMENKLGKDSLRNSLERGLKKTFDKLTLDSVEYKRNEPEPPFRYSILYQATQRDILVDAEENFTVLPLASWLSHDDLPTIDLNRTMDYYPNYPFNEKFTYQFIFPYPVEVINEKSLQADYKNDYGSYSLKVFKQDEKTITLESVYTITREKIPADKYTLLKEINYHWMNSKDAKMMIRKR
jgi:hypothetical protein